MPMKRVAAIVVMLGLAVLSVGAQPALPGSLAESSGRLAFAGVDQAAFDGTFQAAGVTQIYAVELPATEAVVLYDGELLADVVRVTCLAWQPDGGLAVDALDAAGNTVAFVVDAGGEATSSETLACDAVAPVVSPDGARQAAYELDVLTQFTRVIVSDVGDPNASPMFEDAVASDSPVAWSPDSRFVAFTAALRGTDGALIGTEIALIEPGLNGAFLNEADTLFAYAPTWELPAVEPTATPTIEPTVEPTATPTIEPTVEPTATPTIEPTVEPTATPTIEPTVEPTATPTIEPTVEPTATPTIEPTVEPTTEEATTVSLTLYTPVGDIDGFTPPFVWAHEPGVQWYSLWVSDGVDTIYSEWHEAALVCRIEVCVVDTGISYAAGQTYVWQVQTGVNSIYGERIGEGSFVNSSQSTPAVLVAPLDMVGNLSPTFIWAHQNSATWYQILVSDGANSVYEAWYEVWTTNLCSTGVCEVTPPITLTAGTTYEWSVQVFTTELGEWSPQGIFSVGLAAPQAVAPLGSSGTPNPIFSWTPVTGATSYELWVSDGANTVLNDTYALDQLTCNTITCYYASDLDLPAGDTRYYWWVRAKDAALGDGLWSSENIFTFQPSES
jgi:hypothetical protein